MKYYRKLAFAYFIYNTTFNKHFYISGFFYNICFHQIKAKDLNNINNKIFYNSLVRGLDLFIKKNKLILLS